MHVTCSGQSRMLSLHEALCFGESMCADKRNGHRGLAMADRSDGNKLHLLCIYLVQSLQHSSSGYGI